MNRKLVIAILVLLTVALGFLRDYVFVTLNHAIETGNDVSGSLYLLKWPLTALFFLLYLLLTCLFLFQVFGKRKYVLLAFFSYGLLLGFSLVCGAIGWLFSSFEATYPLIRAVLGIAQSPVPAMALLAAALIDQRTGRN